MTFPWSMVIRSNQCFRRYPGEQRVHILKPGMHNRHGNTRHVVQGRAEVRFPLIRWSFLTKVSNAWTSASLISASGVQIFLETIQS